MISAKNYRKLSPFVLAISLTFTLSSSFNAEAYTPTNEMRDLSSNNWAYKSIEALVDKYGIMSGFPDKTFKGYKNLTRYEMAAALYKVMTKVEELIARSGKAGLSETKSMVNSASVSEEDLATIKALQQEFKKELNEIEGRVERIENKLKIFNKVKIGGKVELKYRDRMSVTDPTKTSSPLNGMAITDNDKGKFLFNDPSRNLLTEFDRTPFRMKTTFDISASLTPGMRFYGSFVADDGTLFRLGNTNGQAVGGHFFAEGLTGNSLYTKRSILSLRNNFSSETELNSAPEDLDYQPLEDDLIYHQRKSGMGLSLGFMNFKNIAQTGTKFKNHFDSDRWLGHGYGLVGFGADDLLVKNTEVTDEDKKKIPVRNSVSRFWASGINVSSVDPDSQRYNDVPSPAVAFDTTIGPVSLVLGANYGSPYVNRVSSLNNNIGGGETATINQSTTPLSTKAFSTQASPSGILVGGDSPEKLVNEKVILGSKDPITPWTSGNLLNLPSEYGDGYGLLGFDLDLGWLRFASFASDYWLDSSLSLSGTRKSVSSVLDIGSNALGVTLQANYFGLGLDSYSSGLFMNDIGGSGVDFGFGAKSASRGIFNFGQLTGTNIGTYVALPEFSPALPKLLLAMRQTFGDSFGQPVSVNGTKLSRVSTFKDSGITLRGTFDNVLDSGVEVALEYNSLIEGPLWGFNFMAHDLGFFTTYKF